MTPDERECAHTEFQAHMKVDIGPFKTYVKARRIEAPETEMRWIWGMRNWTGTTAKC